MAGKAARGAGTIRKKTVTRSGKPILIGRPALPLAETPAPANRCKYPSPGKQKEVREKLQAATVAVDAGLFVQPERMTVSEWLDIWTAEYLGGVKPNTARIYRNNVKRHIKPALGAVRLPELRPHDTGFYQPAGACPGIRAAGLQSAVSGVEKGRRAALHPQNPAEGCTLPRLEQEEIKPMDDKQITALLNAAQGAEVEQLIKTALFTGCRLSELLGLTWDCVGRDTITISKQLARPDQRADGPFISPKNGKSRTLTPAPLVLDALKAQKRMQTAARIKAGPLWDNAYNLVFTTETGAPVSQWKIERVFSKILAAAGLHGIRFHDLRHTYAVNAIRAGDDIKTVQRQPWARLCGVYAGQVRPLYRADETGQRRPHGGLYKRCFEPVKGKLKGKHAHKEHEKPPNPCIFKGWRLSCLSTAGCVCFFCSSQSKRAAPWRGPQNKRGVRSAVHLAHRARGVVLPDDAVDLLEIGRRQIARHCVFDAGCGVTELHGFLRIAVF